MPRYKTLGRIITTAVGIRGTCKRKIYSLERGCPDWAVLHLTFGNRCPHLNWVERIRSHRPTERGSEFSWKHTNVRWHDYVNIKHCQHDLIQNADGLSGWSLGSLKGNIVKPLLPAETQFDDFLSHSVSPFPNVASTHYKLFYSHSLPATEIPLTP